MNVRAPELVFRSNRTEKVDILMPVVTPDSVDTEDTPLTDVKGLSSTDDAIEPKTVRLLLCSKTKDMAEKVSRAIGEDDHFVVDLADRSLMEIANGDLRTISNYSIVVVEIEPDDATEMAALRSITARAPEKTRFLAVTPQALTLTVARELMDAGVSEVLPMTSILNVQPSQGSVENAVIQTAAPLHSGLVLAIAQTRGGIGATSLAVNLAAMLSAPKSKRDKTPKAKVALLDLDFQNGDAAASLDIEDNGALIELLKTQADPDAAFLRRAMISYKDQFDVLATPVEFAPYDALSSEKVAQMVNELRQMYDYVILGMPRAMVRWIEPVLARADQLLLVTDTSVTGVRQARRLIDFYIEDNPGLPLEIVVSKEKKPFSTPKAVKEATKLLEKPFDIWLPYDERTAVKAADRGVPMVEVASRSVIVKPLRQIIGKLQQIHSSDKRREG